MADEPNTSDPTGTVPPEEARPGPEEMGRDPAGPRGALEPEAVRTSTDEAAKAGDRMWGEPGTPPRED